jgi:hypothetical protein
MSTYGLQINDEVGNPVLRITDRITRVLGMSDTGTGNGSLQVSAFSTGTPFFHVRDDDALNSTSAAPEVQISGSSIVWTFPATTLPYRSVNVVYGVF